MGVLDKLRSKYTTKQMNTLERFIREQPEVTILSGGKRAGKTFLLVLLFLMEAKKHKDKQFIIVGSNISSVKRNIITEMERYLGRTIRLGKSNDFELFSNKVTVFQGSNADCWKSIRGFTSHLTLINEATAQHEDTIKECFDRTSGANSKILADTNTSNPYHFFKTNYIDKDGNRDEEGQLKVMAEHFTLFDNTYLTKQYIERQLLLYEEGSVDFRREIMGVWVGKEGMVYPMFKQDIHVVKEIPKNIKYVICGVDWGWEHYGTLVVVAKTTDNKYYVLEEVAEQHRDIDWWLAKAIELQKKWKISTFWCDSARQEYIVKFQRGIKGANVYSAKKDVIEGITTVSQLLVTKSLFILSGVKKLVEEMYQYVWKGGSSEEVVKEFDDCQDSLRYAIYNDKLVSEKNDKYKNFKGAKQFSMYK